MRNQKIKKISIGVEKNPKKRFNLSHDINTTMSMGDTMPLVCRLVPPKSKTSLQLSSLVRLAPMVAPAFARLNFRQWHYFVGMSDLTRNFDALLAQTSVSRGENTFTPTELPNIDLCNLSVFCLFGAHFTLYENIDVNSSRKVCQLYTPKLPNGQENAAYNDFISAVLPEDSYSADMDLSTYGIPYKGSCVLTTSLVGETTEGHFARMWIPCGNLNRRSFSGLSSYTDDHDNHDVVTLDSADYVYEGYKNNKRFCVAWRFSDFGKRIYKILVGCGYQFNLVSQRKVSLMPLFAYFKAYYDCFGLTLYQNYDTTNCAKLLTYFDFYNDYNFNFGTGTMSQEFNGFMYDLANCWATLDQDYISLHLNNLAVSPSTSQIRSEIIDVGKLDGETDPTIAQSDSQSQDFEGNPHAFINRIRHDYLDEEILKRLYLWTNKNTVAGHEIRKRLIAQGLGDYVNQCKPRFVGYHSQPITISDVVSTSDTYKDGSGSLLGEYAGRGLEYSNGKHFGYENDEFGFYIVIAAITPDSGYSQGINPLNFVKRKFDFYTPDFDAKGMEANDKSLICGSRTWRYYHNESEANTFGYVPRFSNYKVQQNVVNGGFSLRSKRDAFATYSLDRLIDVDAHAISDVSADVPEPTTKTFIFKRLFNLNDLPNAGNSWRFYTKYPWLGHFERIFANYENKDYLGTLTTATSESNPILSVLSNPSIEFLLESDDNFVVHNIANFALFAPMKPIEESFETENSDDNFNGHMSRS